MTQPGKCGAQQHLAPLRFFHCDVLDRQRFLRRVQDGGLHGVSLPGFPDDLDGSDFGSGPEGCLDSWPSSARPFSDRGNLRCCCGSRWDSPLEAQNGRFILKYFLLEERRKGRAEPIRKFFG